MTQIERRTVIVDGMITSFLEAGRGDPLVLLHGGEFGASAELGWEHNIAVLAEHYRVIAPDQIGYGETAKVIDFNDGRRMRIRHVAQLLALLGIEEADFVGNSMGGVNLLVDATSSLPLLPVKRMVIICAGGTILRNRFSNALFEYDATFEAMRAIVEALFHDPSYPADDAYVQRRFESSTAPGAWEAIAAARFRRPDTGRSVADASPVIPKQESDYGRVRPRTLLIEGSDDKLKPKGWAAEIAAAIPDGRSIIVDSAAHCPQIEQPGRVHDLILEFLAGGEPS